MIAARRDDWRNGGNLVEDYKSRRPFLIMIDFVFDLARPFWMNLEGRPLG
ncbi:unnamed protein product [Amoebophrya sp. A25]|nr:unnamed protein product [Amoebophrya sp. A25]|eukprot:GSA25T00027042001.1